MIYWLLRTVLVSSAFAIVYLLTLTGLIPSPGQQAMAGLELALSALLGAARSTGEAGLPSLEAPRSIVESLWQFLTP